jgi:hypothetical protein
MVCVLERGGIPRLSCAEPCPELVSGSIQCLYRNFTGKIPEQVRELRGGQIFRNRFFTDPSDDNNQDQEKKSLSKIPNLYYKVSLT